MKKIIYLILIIIVVFGLVYTSISIIKNKETETTGQQQEETETIEQPEQQEKAKQVKWGMHKISMTDDVETIKENMLQYDDNIYILRIKDYETYKEKVEELSIDIEEDEYSYINEDTFEKIDYEVIIAVFINHQPIQLNNVLPYDSRLVLEFTYRDDMTENENIMCFCASVPKDLSNDKIEIECKRSELEQMPEDAIQFIRSSFYIENIDEFDKEENLTYDEEQDIYYIKGINKDDYNALSERLGIITNATITDEHLIDENSVIVVFKKTSNKIELAKFNYADEKYNVILQETDEQYGKGISGTIIILKNVSNAEDYGIIMK